MQVYLLTLCTSQPLFKMQAELCGHVSSSQVLVHLLWTPPLHNQRAAAVQHRRQRFPGWNTKANMWLSQISGPNNCRIAHFTIIFCCGMKKPARLNTVCLSISGCVTLNQSIEKINCSKLAFKATSGSFLREISLETLHWQSTVAAENDMWFR